MRDNIVNVFGARLADGLVPLHAETAGGSKLEGYRFFCLAVITCTQHEVTHACSSNFTHQCCASVQLCAVLQLCAV